MAEATLILVKSCMNCPFQASFKTAKEKEYVICNIGREQGDLGSEYPLRTNKTHDKTPRGCKLRQRDIIVNLKSV